MYGETVQVISSFLYSVNWGRKEGKEKVQEEQDINLKWQVRKRALRTSIRVLKPTAHTHHHSCAHSRHH